MAVGFGFIGVHVWASSEVNGIGIDYAEGGHALAGLGPPSFAFSKSPKYIEGLMTPSL